MFASTISKFGNRRPLVDRDVLNIVHRIDHLHFFDPTHCFRRVTRTGTYFCFEARLPTPECRSRKEFFEMHLRDLILRLFNRRILWISSFCNRGRIQSRNISGISRCWNCKALSVLICFINSRSGSPCAEKHRFVIRSGGISCAHTSLRRCCRFI